MTKWASKLLISREPLRNRGSRDFFIAFSIENGCLAGDFAAQGDELKRISSGK